MGATGKAKPRSAKSGLPRINVAGIDMFEIDSWETLERIFEEIARPKRKATVKAKPKTKTRKR